MASLSFSQKLGLRVRRESHEGSTEGFLELKGVVNLDGTTVLDMVPWSSSQVIQSSLSNVSNTENTSSITTNGGVGILHVDSRFVSYLSFDTHTLQQAVCRIMLNSYVFCNIRLQSLFHRNTLLISISNPPNHLRKL